MALGLGFPYLFLALFSNLLQALPRSGDWMLWVKQVFGVLMVNLVWAVRQLFRDASFDRILAALMAGHDPEARRVFDGMYAHFRDHPSGITPSLMSWYQSASCASANGNDTASDGDFASA